MGRLSAYAKNRILKLRFKKNKRIIHIVEILRKDDNIKVSRQAVSTFLKKYLETNSIYDKPRTGRKRKLTQEEIQLIGQVTRLNRDITARAIKEYLNLNVSTYTILRATKLFEWNKINPNSNDSKKAAALERQLNGEIVKPSRSGSASSGKRVKRKSNGENHHETTTMQVVSMSEDEMNASLNDDKNSSMNEIETVDLSKLESSQQFKTYQRDHPNNHNNSSHNDTQFSEPEKVDLNLLTHKELLALKNLSCSPMSFATKILFKIFKIEELHGHNVSGKTLNKNIKAKLPLDSVRIGYIKFLVEKYYNEKECKEMLSSLANHKQDLWKSCHTAINKSILISERKSAAALANGTATNKSSLNSNGVDEVASALGILNDSIDNINKSTDTDDDEDLEYDDDLGDDDNSSDSNSDDEDDDDDHLDKDSSSSSEDEVLTRVKREKVIQKKKLAPAKPLRSTPIQRRQSSRLKKPNSKFTPFDESDGEDEDDDESAKINDENGIRRRVKDEDEVELIQNIENRQKQNNKNSTQTKQQKQTTAAATSKQPLAIISPPPAQQQTSTSNTTTSGRAKRQIKTKKDQESSSEASAAANIAAAMKKRFVVIASNQKGST